MSSTAAVPSTEYFARLILSARFVTAHIRTRSGSDYTVVKRNGIATVIRQDGKAATGDLTLGRYLRLTGRAPYRVLMSSTEIVDIKIVEN
jgi:hypothetical protein